MQDSEFLFAIDLGTTNVKAAVFTISGEMVASDQAEHQTYRSGDGTVEQHPEEVWRVQCTVCNKVLRKSKVDPQMIRGVAISTQRGTFVLVDENNRPMTNYITWMDMRGVPYLKEIVDRLGEETYYTISGMALIYPPSVSKLLWFKNQAPGLFEKAKRYHLVQTQQLSRMGADDEVCDYANATLSGLLDVDNLRWSERIIGELGLPMELFPNLVSPGEVVGYLSETASRETGLAKGTPLVAGGGDLACAGMGSGVIEEGHVTINHGTGAGLMTYLERPKRDAGMAFLCGVHVVPGAWEMEGHDQASGASMRWFRDAFSSIEKSLSVDLGIDTYQLLTLEASGSPPGSNGLIFIPTLCGLTQPVRVNDAKGMVFGLGLDHNKKDFIRALMEGACVELRWMFEGLESQGLSFKEVVVTGGASKSELWNQIHADVYELPVRVPELAESSLVGAAILAGMGAGVFTDVADGVNGIVRYRKSYVPNRENTHVYEDLFYKYKSIIRTTSENKFHEMLSGPRAE